MMVICPKRFFFCTVYEKWFSKKFKFTDLVTLTAHLHTRDDRPGMSLGIKRVSYTLENYIDQDMETIYAGFSKNIRNGISKAKEAGIVTHFSHNTTDFVEFYNSFALKKKIPIISERRLLELGENLLIGYASCEGKILAAHSYLIDQEEGIVRIFWGCSARLQKNMNKKMAEWANKLLYFEGMAYFKSQGIRIYDWGGYAMNTKNEQLERINNFKKQYGGKIVTCVNYYSPGYLLFRGFAKLLGLLGKG